MKFNDKLTRMLSITETSSIQLAKKLLLDPSQVSRMKTGTRGKPTNIDLIWKMSLYFASHCNTEYKISAVSELVGNSRLLVTNTEKVLTEAIFEWLCAEKFSSNMHIDNFLEVVSGYSDKENLLVNEKSYTSPLGSKHQSTNYEGNNGKRQAVLDMLNMLIADNKPSDIYVYTDENNSWFTESPTYASKLAEKISLLAQKGYMFYRVNTTHDSLETTLKGIEQWLSAYICGAVREYHYPFLRDELHRRTLFVAPDRLALFSHSLARQTESRITTLSTEPSIINQYYEEVQDIFALCRPMTSVYTMAEPDSLLACLRRMAATEADGIYKTASLSIPTIPLCIVERIAKKSNSTIVSKIIRNQRERAELRNDMLTRHRIQDIMTLADIEQIKQGKVPFPSTKMLHDSIMYYTPQEYKLHLQSIVDSLMQYPNYQVILTNNSIWKDIILYAKEDGSVLMIKDRNPFALFEITEKKMAAGMYDFLKQISMQERKQTDRNETISKLKKLIEELS